MQISYAALCFTGLIRTNNEDNFCINGQYRLPTEADFRTVRTGLAAGSGRPFFAVFDGMGGESCGEIASYTAAVSCSQAMSRKGSVRGKLFPKLFVRDIFYEMNRAVCNYAAEHKIRSMGSTAAMLYFTGTRVIYANVGDSRIYRFSGELQQLSADHVEKTLRYRKGPLTQYLGLPETEVMIEPHIGEERPDPGTKYLLCSDGVTDMLNDRELAGILAEDMLLPDMAEAMRQKILSKGAEDNVILILCEVTEK